MALVVFVSVMQDVVWILASRWDDGHMYIGPSDAIRESSWLRLGKNVNGEES